MNTDDLGRVIGALEAAGFTVIALDAEALFAHLGTDTSQHRERRAGRHRLPAT